MKTPCFFLAFIFYASLSTQAQARLIGQVTLQNSGNQSAYPAQVRSFGATDTDVATEDGAFHLVFDKKRAGNSVEINVIKPGYEVVNRQDLTYTLPVNPSAQRRLKLYLCPQGQWRTAADRFYKINYNNIVARHEKSLERARQEFAAGLATQAGYQKQLEQMNADLAFALREAERLSEVFAKANLDDAGERFNRAYEYFSRGLIDSVLIVLDEEKMLEDLHRTDREIDDALALIDLGELMVEDGDALRTMIRQAQHWKDSLERDGLDHYAISLQPDTSEPAGINYPPFPGGLLRVWLRSHRAQTVPVDAGGECTLRRVRRALAGQTFGVSLDAHYWSLSQPALRLDADTLTLHIRPDGSLGLLRGQVVSRGTGSPLAGIEVICEGQYAQTDNTGRYTLNIPTAYQKTSYTLHFRVNGVLLHTSLAEADDFLYLLTKLDLP